MLTKVDILYFICIPVITIYNGSKFNVSFCYRRPLRRLFFPFLYMYKFSFLKDLSIKQIIQMQNTLILFDKFIFDCFKTATLEF